MRKKLKRDYELFFGPAPNDLQAIADRIEPLIAALDDPQYHKILRILQFRRPWRPRHVGWVNVIDQLLHVIYAVLIFIPLLLWPSWFTAAASGFILGTIREWEQWKNQDLKILMFWDRLQDVLFFILGAMALYAIKTILI